MTTKLRRRLVILLVALCGTCFPVTKYSTNSGNWSTASTWSPSGAPACGDSLVILGAHKIVISSNQSYMGCGSAMKVTVKGELFFTNGSKLTLDCSSSFFVYYGGDIDSDGGGSSNRIQVCNVTYWQASDGRFSGPGCIPATPGCAGTLPVKLSAFGAAGCTDTDICLQWITATELQCDHFEVERSTDSYFFNRVASVSTQATGGNSNSPLNYSFTDRNALDGMNYYRLKTLDRDGSSSYGGIISAQPGLRALSAQVYPNPCRDNFTMQLPAEFVGNVLVEILGSAGLAIGTFADTDAAHRVKVSLLDFRLSPGVYVVTASSGGHVERMKIVKL